MSEQKDVVDYAAWRISFQSSEQAARAAFTELTRLRAELEHETKRRRAIDDEAFDYSEQVERLRAENARKDMENAHLRVTVQKVGCPYGHRDPETGACVLGYPGCACMDDIMATAAWSPEDEEKAAVRLGARVRDLEATVARLEAEKAEAVKKIRAFRNYATGIIAQYESGDYENRRANAEARFNEFEDALDAVKANIVKARCAMRGNREQNDD